MSFIEVIVNNIKKTLKRVCWHWLLLDFGKVKGDFNKHVCGDIGFSWLLPQTNRVWISKHVCAQSLHRRPTGRPPKRQRWTLKKVINLYSSSISSNFVFWSVQTLSSPRATVGTTLSWNIAEQVSFQSKVVLGKRWIVNFLHSFSFFFIV